MSIVSICFVVRFLRQRIILKRTLKSETRKFDISTRRSPCLQQQNMDGFVRQSFSFYHFSSFHVFCTIMCSTFYHLFLCLFYFFYFIYFTLPRPCFSFSRSSCLSLSATTTPSVFVLIHLVDYYCSRPWLLRVSIHSLVLRLSGNTTNRKKILNKVDIFMELRLFLFYYFALCLVSRTAHLRVVFGIYGNDYCLVPFLITLKLELLLRAFVQQLSDMML